MSAAEEQRPTEEPARVRRSAPNLSVNVWQLMEDVLDKLKALDYETKFCANHGVQPFAHSYFAMEDKNRDGQFTNFLQIVSWLVAELKEEGVSFEVGEYDDPNTSVTKLMLAIKSCGFTADVQAMKLKQGHGEAVLVVLNFLCDSALARSSFKWGQPQRPTEEYEEDVEGDLQADVGSDIEDDLDAESDGEEDLMYTELVREARAASAVGEGADDLDKSSAADHSMIKSEIDPVMWAAELERVGPRLRASGAASVDKEWRGHIEQTIKHETTIAKHLPATQTSVEQIASAIGSTLERMSAKEKFINNQFEQICTDYAQTQTKLKEVTEQHKLSSDNVEGLASELQMVQETLAEIKERMNSRGDSMTDTSPLVQIKKALQKVKEDIKTFELRIGVVGHTLMQAKLRASAGHQNRARVTGNGGAAEAMGDEVEFEMSDDEEF